MDIGLEWRWRGFLSGGSSVKMEDRNPYDGAGFAFEVDDTGSAGESTLEWECKLMAGRKTNSKSKLSSRLKSPETRLYWMQRDSKDGLDSD